MRLAATTNPRPRAWVSYATLALLATLLAPRAWAATTLYPDLIVRTDDLYDYDLVTSIQPGHVHLRLSVGTANIGAGALQIYGVLPDNGDGTQNVNQRLFDDAGGYTDHAAGVFVYHPEHHHVHLAGWTQYRIRTILADGGVGPILATGEKTSFCLMDYVVYDSQLPHFNPTPVYAECGSTTQGISVGWVDIYNKSLPGQNIDVTGIANGTYWLEVEVDPDHDIDESDETNNISRVKVVIGQPAGISADRFEPNGDREAVMTRTVGAANSPNLGPTAPLTELNQLTVDTGSDDDWFRFYAAGAGSAEDFVEISFSHSLGDLDLEIYDSSSGQWTRRSEGTTNIERISLMGLGPGWYFVRVYGYHGAKNPDYTLRIQPPASVAPTITTDSPPPGNTVLVHALDAYPVQWTATDPQDPVWVTIYLNREPIFDGNEFVVPGMTHLNAADGTAVINSAEIPDGTWWVYCSATDGGAVTGDWSSGTVTFTEPLGVPHHPGDHSAASLHLLPPAPNPFRGRTALALELHQEEHVRWDIVDASGRVVRVLHDGVLAAGPHTIPFDGGDARGAPLPSGVYFSRVTTRDDQARQKLVLLR